MIREGKKFVKLSSEEKKLFLEAYMTLGIMRAAILRVSLKYLTRSLEYQQNDMEIIALDATQLQTALLVGRAIGRASNYTPWESACLAQSLTARKMLEKRAIPGVFYLGVAKDDDVKEKMKAHSWTQCGEKIITGREGYEDFTILSVFGWYRK